MQVGEESSSQPEEEEDFEVTIVLTQHDDGRVLTPLAIPNYGKAAKNKTVEAVPFEISVFENDLEKLEVEIKSGGTTLFIEELKGDFLKQGGHAWLWDGYDNSDILSTTLLKGELDVIARGTFQGVTKEDTLEIEGSFAHVDWVDVTITRGATAAVELRVEFADGGQKGVGSAAPRGVTKAHPKTSYPTGAHVRLRPYAALRGLALAGIDKYWSRTISTPVGGHSVVVMTTDTPTESMNALDLIYNTNKKYGRSSNPGTSSSVLSFGAQLFFERIFYNVGWIKFSNGWHYRSAGRADDDFQETAAHEVGHTILQAYGGDEYSYQHKGTSTLLTQRTLKVSEGGEAMPTSGEVDLMKYYNSPVSGAAGRTMADETDVEALLWLSAVKLQER